MKALSLVATAVLQAVATGHGHGFDVMAATGLPSGTVYPALRRLEEEGWLDSRWENHRIAREELRPPRKYYEITNRGEEALTAALARYRGAPNSGTNVGPRVARRRPLKSDAS